MLITERKFGTVKIVNIYFVEEPVPVNIPDYHVVTYHTYKNWGEIPGFERKQYLTATIDLRQDSGAIWNSLKRYRRRQILRSEEEGTTVTVSNNYEGFHQLLKKFLKRKNYGDPSGLGIISSEFMQKYGTLFIAENQGEILGGYLYFHDEENALPVNVAYQEFGDSIERKKRISDANSFIQWEAMQYFKNLGAINYDFGGLGGDDTNIDHTLDGLNYYKLSYGGDVIPQYEYRKFNSRFYNLVFDSWNFFMNAYIIPARIKKKSNNFS